MSRIVKIAYYVLVVIAVIYGIAYLIWGDNNPNQGSSIALILAYILGGLAVAITIIAAIGNIVQHPKSSVKLLVGIGAVALIAIIGYSVSKGEVLDSYIDGNITKASQSKLIDAAWYLCYSILGIAVVGILVSEFTGLFKN